MRLGTDMYAIRDRRERSKEFEKRRGSLSPEARDVIEQMIQKEEQHKRYMDNPLHVARSFSMEGRKPHDYSKDELFCFVYVLPLRLPGQHRGVEEFGPRRVREPLRAGNPPSRMGGQELQGIHR